LTASVISLPAILAFALRSDGERLAEVGALIGGMFFVIVAIGTRFGQVPTSGAAAGRVAAMRPLRWIGLGAVIVGLGMMTVAALR
jgi:hypothetical protein